MNATACALLGFVTWSIILTIVLLGVRIAAMAGGKPLNAFSPDGKDLAPLGVRVTRAHGNSLEYLAIMVGLLGYAIASGQTVITDSLAMLVFYSRMGQSVVHMISTSKPAVLIRASLFTVQIIVALMWIWRFATAA